MRLRQKIRKSDFMRLFILYFISLFSLEIIFRLVSGIILFDFSLFRIFLGILIIDIIFSYVLSFLSQKTRYTFFLITIFFACCYAIAQMGFNSFVGVYMSLNTSSQLGAVKDYVKDFIHSFKPTYYFVFISFIIGVLNVFLLNKYDFEKPELNFKKKIYKSLCCAIALISFSLVYSLSLYETDELQMVNNKALFKNPTIPSLAVKNFGILGFGLDDLKLHINGEDNSEIVANIAKKKEENDVRKFDDTLWQRVINSETNQEMNNISNYLINNRSTSKNDYTGQFKGKNVIFIMMESTGEIIINKDKYPNFYKMYTEGYSFKNNYSPRNACPTGNNEFSGMTSLYSIYNNCTANTYKDNVYPESVFNLFKNSGYNAISMHDYTEAYYFRRTIHTNMGSQRYYGVEDLGINYSDEYKDWASDEDFANAATDIINNDYSDKPFMLWMTTVSSHQPYSVDSITGNQYINEFIDLPYSMDVKRYMSKLKILDNALGIMMNKLESTGKLKDTVFVLYGDHYPYGISLDDLQEVLHYDLSDYENERTPFLIYSPAMEAKSFEQYTTYINITPTIANLFDLNYDPRLYMGNDVLDKSYESRAVFADGSWKNELAYYNALNSSVKFYQDNAYTNDEIISINQDISAKMNMSSAIIKNNYYNYLDNRIKMEANEQNGTLANKEE
jgi:lipoteichoic acid synthase